MKKDDPYHDDPIYHHANKINTQTGRASALCYKTPHAIPRHEAFTTRPGGKVTCPKCRKLLASAAPSNNMEDAQNKSNESA